MKKKKGTIDSTMIHILDFNFYLKGKIALPMPPDLNKCLKQIKLTISLLASAPLSKLPSNISTMDSIKLL